ncbi:hypothetical protein CYMTET_4356 [Cymbomonas tetramitiformis]|uniref:Uncharacterized protein n=1 Tax=Cymbomonas tetramitiformis TaxID=36881 RepID=A0AAE0LKK7_9CHLO|nr:hypothetical protein CYMTET_4356 [Cymbomonas tetramitiformis]
MGKLNTGGPDGEVDECMETRTFENLCLRTAAGTHSGQGRRGTKLGVGIRRTATQHGTPRILRTDARDGDNEAKVDKSFREG